MRTNFARLMKGATITAATAGPVLAPVFLLGSHQANPAPAAAAADATMTVLRTPAAAKPKPKPKPVPVHRVAPAIPHPPGILVVHVSNHPLPARRPVVVKRTTTV